MLGMTREQIEAAITEWYANNQDKVSAFAQGFNPNASTDDDVMHLVSRVMASVGSTVAMSAITEVMEKNNKVLTEQINQLIEQKLLPAQRK